MLDFADLVVLLADEEREVRNGILGLPLTLASDRPVAAKFADN